MCGEIVNLLTRPRQNIKIAG